MCQKRTDSQKPLSGAWAKVQGHATAQLQLSNQSPTMCQLGLSVMKNSLRHNYKATPNAVYASATQPPRRGLAKLPRVKSLTRRSTPREVTMSSQAHATGVGDAGRTNWPMPKPRR